MKLLVIFAIFAVLVCASAAIPPQFIYDGPTYELTAVDEPTATDDTANAGVRQRRVTCDLLSWTSKWLSVNHSACALKCLTQRRRGGRCRDGVCVCR